MFNDAHFNLILDKIGFNNKFYPKTQAGLILYLQECGIRIAVFPDVNGKFMYVAIDDSLHDIFTEDWTHYDSFDDALNAGIIESCAYLSFNHEQIKKSTKKQKETD